MSLDEGLATVGDVVDLLEAHGVDVRDARDVATSTDGETVQVQAQLRITASVGASLNTSDVKAAIDEAHEDLDEAGDST